MDYSSRDDVPLFGHFSLNALFGSLQYLGIHYSIEKVQNSAPTCLLRYRDHAR